MNNSPKYVRAASRAKSKPFRKLVGYNCCFRNLELHKKKGSIDKIRKLADYALSNLGCSMTKLALAWCIKNKNVSTILLCITKPEQLKENIGCLSVVENLTSEQMTDINNILDNRPELYAGFAGQGMRQIVTI